MTNELFYTIALTLVPGIGTVQAKQLLQEFTPEEIFKAKKSQLEKIEGIGEIRAQSILSFSAFEEAEEEIAFIEKYKITPLTITDKNYPKRLLNCYDPPVILYHKGTTDFNTTKVLAIIGSRKHTEYGKSETEKIISELTDKDILIISGLAYGIDAIAHKAALQSGHPTAGVLAHGLSQLYPAQHASLAKEMIAHEGGLLTEFRSKTNPDKHNFPIRNRIVAGLADAVLVIETAVKGGSMITAELANSYNREVFALPGKTTDRKSTGCNYLIKNNKAILLDSTEGLLQSMNWDNQKKKSTAMQQKLFTLLSDDEKLIVRLLNECGKLHIDELRQKTNFSGSNMAAAILNLELQGVILSLPGKIYIPG